MNDTVTGQPRAGDADLRSVTFPAPTVCGQVSWSKTVAWRQSLPRAGCQPGPSLLWDWHTIPTSVKGDITLVSRAKLFLTGVHTKNQTSNGPHVNELINSYHRQQASDQLHSLSVCGHFSPFFWHGVSDTVLNAPNAWQPKPELNAHPCPPTCKKKACFNVQNLAAHTYWTRLSIENLQTCLIITTSKLEILSLIHRPRVTLARVERKRANTRH